MDFPVGSLALCCQTFPKAEFSCTWINICTFPHTYTRTPKSSSHQEPWCSSGSQTCSLFTQFPVTPGGKEPFSPATLGFYSLRVYECLCALGFVEFYQLVQHWGNISVPHFFFGNKSSIKTFPRQKGATALTHFPFRGTDFILSLNC